jgi:AcrR family transcriptional regulator
MFGRGDHERCGVALTQNQRSTASRQRLIRTAVKLVGQRGVDGFRLSDLGAKDKSLAVVYFKTKEGLILAATQHVLAAQMVPRAVDAGFGSVVGAVKAAFDRAGEDPDSARALAVFMTSLTLDGAIGDLVASAKAEQRKQFEEALEVARKDRSARYDSDPAAQAALIASGLQATIALVISDVGVDRCKIQDEFIRCLTLSLEAGLARKRPARKHAAEEPAFKGDLFDYQ